MISKYRAIKTEVNGITFDSKKEAKRYQELLLLKRSGEITDIKLQPEFTLLEKFTHESSKEKVRGIKYKADFLITYADGHQEIEDVKGVKTDVYSLKKKLFLKRYPHLKINEI